jgi:phosphatidylglycerophosphate synthase
MLDGVMRKLIDPALDRAGANVARLGISADQISLLGLALGLGCAIAVAVGQFAPALMLLALSRIADGLDGAVARVNGRSDFGGYLDIVCDFAFYGAVPLAFVALDPIGNAVPGALLLASFYVNGATFLGFTVLAERNGLALSPRAGKSLYFTSGLLEGTETIAFLAAVMIWPAAFATLALLFAAGCLLTATSRVVVAWRRFGRPQT